MRTRWIEHGVSASILLIDNYDSFVYNLARYFAELGCETVVVRNDVVTVDDVRDARPSAIILSPGPCTPTEAGVSVELIRQLGQKVPTLGVCLGHQAIAAAFGGTIRRAADPVHGRTSQVVHDGLGLFAGLPNPLTAARYHSLVVDEASLPDSMTVPAHTTDGVVMGIAHRDWPVYGVQFHPESILTPGGRRLLHNFLTLAAIPSVLPDIDERIEHGDTHGDFFSQSIQRDHPPPGLKPAFAR